MIACSNFRKAVGGLGFVLIILGIRFSSENLVYAGATMFSGYFILQGIEAIINRRVALDHGGTKFHPNLYLEWSDVAQGILFLIFGALLFSIALAGFFGVAQTIFRYLVHHPAPIFFALSLTCFVTAVKKAIGTGNQRSKLEWQEWLRILVTQFFPAILLAVIAFVFLGLGLWELLAPDVFDRLGGGLLEILFEN